MKIIDICSLFRQISVLSESKEGKNTHLEHIEDHIFNRGHTGAQEALNYMSSLVNMLHGSVSSSISMSTKWDGSPSIISGKDPATGKFFVGTKGVFAKNPKMNFTVDDIRANHPDAGLQKILTIALKNLSKLNMNTVVQGDLLFTKESIRRQTIDGVDYITFKPNTIVYAIPAGSDLAKTMLAANMGIVFHTEYVGGNTLADTHAKFGFDASTLSKNRAVWFRDAKIQDLSGTVTFTHEESTQLQTALTKSQTLLQQLGKNAFSWLDKGITQVGKDFVIYLKAHINANIKNAGSFETDATEFARSFLESYIQRMQNRVSEFKTEAKRTAVKAELAQGVKFIRENLKDIVRVYELYLLLIESKIMIVRKLETIRQIPTFKQVGDSYVATGEEGFVIVDHVGNALKLVDRLEFSRLNFAGGKPGSK